MCDFGLKMNWSETSDLEIIRIFSFSLAKNGAKAFEKMWRFAAVEKNLT